jgi:hypothetical protein
MYKIFVDKHTPNPAYDEEMGNYQAGLANGKYPDKPEKEVVDRVFMVRVEDGDWIDVRSSLLTSLNN